MTGPEHYREAERLLHDGVSYTDGDTTDLVYIAAAQVHATLALAAATAEPIAQAYSGREDNTILRAWSAAIS